MTNEVRLSVGRRLREERIRLQREQVEMAKLLGAKPRTYQDWERGVSAVSSEYLGAAAGLGVDVLYVLTGQRSEPVESSLTPEERALLDHYRNSDEEARRSARFVLKALAKCKAA